MTFTHISSSIVFANEDIIVSSNSAIIVTFTAFLGAYFSDRERKRSETHETRACTYVVIFQNDASRCDRRARCLSADRSPLAASPRYICLPTASSVESKCHCRAVVLISSNIFRMFCFAVNQRKSLFLST